MLTLNYRYRIYPSTVQQERISSWMETCRVAYNYGLREIKDWLGSRKCAVDRCSLVHEYIVPTGTLFPDEVKQLNALPKAKLVFQRLGEVPSQVLQQTIKQLHRSWEGFKEQGHGFPRFKKFGQFKSLLFPQFKKSPIVRMFSGGNFPSGVGGGGFPRQHRLLVRPKLPIKPLKLRQVIAEFVVDLQNQGYQFSEILQALSSYTVSQVSSTSKERHTWETVTNLLDLASTEAQSWAKFEDGQSERS